MVPRAGIEPAKPCGRRIFVPLRFAPPRSPRLESGVRLDPRPLPLGPHRPLSTPAKRFALGLARRCLELLEARGFTDFDGLQQLVSDAAAQVSQVRCVYQFRHRGVAGAILSTVNVDCLEDCPGEILVKLTARLTGNTHRARSKDASRRPANNGRVHDRSSHRGIAVVGRCSPRC
jgi:hypothetical protein